MQITPYRTLEERVTGVVITFVEISELRRAQTALEKLNQQLEARVAERTDQVRALSSSLTMAEQWERRRISQVLHDDLQQLLYGLQMRAQLLLQEMSSASAPELAAQLGELDHLLTEAIQGTRTLSVELNPPVLKGEGLEIGLRWLAHHMQTAYHLTVNLTVDAPTSDHAISESMRMLLIQMTRELLFNVVKHAGVDEATVTISEEASCLLIEVKDEGVGFHVEFLKWHASQAEEHFGLFSVHERLALFGGHLDMASSPGAGARMTIIAPILVESEPIGSNH